MEGVRCMNLERDDLDEKDIETILDWHNIYRNVMANGEEQQGNPGPQQPAKHMMEMVRFSMGSGTLEIFNHSHPLESDGDICFDRSGMTNSLILPDDGRCSATSSRKISAETLASNFPGYIPFFTTLIRPYHFSISSVYGRNVRLFHPWGLRGETERCLHVSALSFSLSLSPVSYCLFVFDFAMPSFVNANSDKLGQRWRLATYVVD